MNVMRTLGLVLLLSLLGACGDSEPPVPKVPPSAPLPKPPVTEPVVPPISLPPTQPPETTKPQYKAPLPKPAPATPAPETKPDLVVKQAPVKVEEAPVPQAKLDLSLPEDLVQSLEPAEPLSTAEQKPLLPQMFAPKPPAESPFQLNGKLITNEREDDYLRSVEGAELQFEFKQ
ncbi:hypothetical protein D3880_13565 [Pseudomonas cavernae]|uniref:Translation initiation factor 2 n=1 Tax=Pseudomonas cavernae TaxID=2320867 RepID=A0A385Z237_9PSED|nr:hypothetical protein [Pseudomonas cavernae]AYC33315.1 hypothetical protein D3880_13565 [Pseudomonas cavernae]